MGAGASLPSVIDKEAARKFAGDKFDESKFDAAATDGSMSRDAFLKAANLPADAAGTPNASPAGAHAGAKLATPAPAKAGPPARMKISLAQSLTPQENDTRAVERQLMEFCELGELDKFHDLLKEKTFTTLRIEDEKGETPIHSACCVGGLPQTAYARAAHAPARLTPPLTFPCLPRPRSPNVLSTSCPLPQCGHMTTM